MGFQFILQALLTFVYTGFADDTIQILLPVGLVSIASYLLFAFYGMKFIPIATATILSTHYVNNILLLSLDGHWEPWIWMSFTTTFILQEFMLRGKSLRWIRILLFGILLLAYCIPTLLQAFVWFIIPDLEGVPADAPANVWIFGYSMLVLYGGIFIDDVLVDDITENTRKINEELDNQKKAYLQIFESLNKLQTYVDAYMTDMSHEVQNAINPLIGLTKLAKQFPDNRKAIQQILEIAEARLVLTSKYIEDTKSYMIALVSAVVNAADTALLTRDASENIDHILDEMKEYAEKLQKALYTEPEQFDIQAFKTQIDIVARGQTHTQVDITISDDVRGVTTYPLAIRTVTTNLLVNSIKYVDTTNARVKILVHRDEDHIVLDINDNGRGIPEEISTKIFEAKKGNVGLWLVHRITEMTNGSISLNREQNGASYTIKIPIVEG